MDIVVINPTYVIGPLLQPTLNFSVEMILELINGNLLKLYICRCVFRFQLYKYCRNQYSICFLWCRMLVSFVAGGTETYPNSYYSFVDVRDVADAHIQAFEIPSASGRYVLTTDCHHYSEILKIAQKYYPTLHLPQKWVHDFALILQLFSTLLSFSSFC